MAVRAFGTVRMTLLVWAALTSPVVAANPTTFTDGDAPGLELPLPTIQSFRGSPLLLEVVLEDPDRVVSAISFATATSTQSDTLSPEVARTPLVLRVSPFFTSGVYDLEVTVHGSNGATRSNTINLAFVDFVWGRDNMSFGNNARYESVVGTFGEPLELEIVDDTGARILAFFPADTDTGIEAVVHATEAPQDGERVTRRIPF